MNRKTVLLVDDDPVIRLLTTEALGAAGFHVDAVATGAEAIAQIAASDPAIVVLDVRLEKEDGCDVCRTLRASPRTVDTPVLMMTALDDDETIDRVYQAGATDFVAKPVSPALLVHRVRYLLRSSDIHRAARTASRTLSRAHRLAKVASWELDLDTMRFRWSELTAQIHNIAPEKREGSAQLLLDVVQPDDRDIVARAFDEDAAEIEFRLMLKDGTHVCRQVTERVVDERTGRPQLVGAFVEVTELRDAEQRVLELAFFDPLTALANRRLLLRYLGTAVENAVESRERVAVLTVDLDGFKRVNDTLGHPAGDALLRAVSRRIVACVGSSSESEQSPSRLNRHLECDVLTARTGGDEFVVVLRKAGDAVQLAALAERIGHELAKPYDIFDTEVAISSSIGLARFPEDAREPGLLLERADAALYRAKEGGRNTYRLFTADLLEKARRKLTIENGIRRALTPDGASDTRFFLEYQPKVRSPEGQVAGAEALLRLRLDGKVVSPLDFIPIAEESGLIVPIGEWVLREACTQARAWMSVWSDPFIVAVNVSARQLASPTFARTVVRVLAETGLPAELLELEVTESCVIADGAAGVEMVTQLKSLGVKIALDDFGTGYSSLSYLMKLPIDTLKIDRAFVRDLVKNPRSQSLTGAIVNLASSLDIKVVVEGVETREQLAILVPLGSLDIQGWYFAKPMAPADLEAWRAAFDASRQRPHRLSVAA